MRLSSENYYSREANKKFFSVSQFKAFDRCPAAAMAELAGDFCREKTTAMLVGSYVDSYFEGTLPAFLARHPGILKRDGAMKADFQQAEAIISRIQRDRLFMDYMSGEKQVILTGTIRGIPIKIKVDSLLPDKIVDLKIMRDFAPVYKEEKGKLPWFEAWGYDLQGAVYQEIVRQNTGKTLPFYLAAATKERKTDLDIIHISQNMMDFSMDHFEGNIELYDAVKKGVVEPVRCEKCDYCRETKVLKEPTEADDYYFDL